MDFYKNVQIKKENFLKSLLLECSSKFEKEQYPDFYFKRIKKDIVFIRYEIITKNNLNEEFKKKMLTKLIKDISFSFSSKYGFESFKNVLLSRKYMLKNENELSTIQLIDIIDKELLEFHFNERSFLSIKLIYIILNKLFEI